MKKYRVQKFIALSGLCSRRKAEKLIEESKVKVNGLIIKLGDQAYETDKIEVLDKKIKFNNDDFIYIVINKPKDYVTSKFDEFGRKIVYDLLKKNDKKKNLFSIGRLDKDTSGLLILTNDGNFAQNVIHPSKKITKKYIFELDKILQSKDKIKIENGILLDEYKLKACEINKISNLKYEISISEGRKRQIRRIFKKSNYLVKNLHRIKIGELDLNELKISLGEYKLLSKEFLENKIFVDS